MLGCLLQSAADLFDLLTNDAKVPSWSRNKATIKPEAGAEVSLFGKQCLLTRLAFRAVWLISAILLGGNITGKVLSVSAPDFFSQTWRAPTWPEGHYGTLKVSLEQGSGSTKLSLDLEGVPVGKEEETEKGLEIYYIRSLKVSSDQSIPNSLERSSKTDYSFHLSSLPTNSK